MSIFMTQSKNSEYGISFFKLILLRYKFILRFLINLELLSNILAITAIGAVHLDTLQMLTTTHSDRCIEAFHCSSAVSGWCAIERHSAITSKKWKSTKFKSNFNIYQKV